jgi:hypothetical protein
MARQVFFDPFGSYVSGFDRGAGRQLQTEGATRQARAQDYDFNTLAPYRLAAMQREDQLGKTILPFQEQLAPFSLLNAQGNFYDAQLKRAGDFAQATNVVAPAANLMDRYFGVTPATTSVGGGDPVTTFFMNNPNGGDPIPVSQQPNTRQGLLDFFNWDRLLKSRQLEDLQNYRQGLVTSANQRAAAAQTSAQARLDAILAKHYQNAGGVTGSSLSGFGSPIDFTNPSLFDPQNTLDQSIPDQNTDLNQFNLGSP